MTKIGETISGWKIQSKIGFGGQSVVFAASRDEGAEEVALKVIKATYPKKLARFIQEVKIHEKLSENRIKNIVPLLDHNLDELEKGGVQGFIAMPMAQTTLEKQRDLLTGRVELCLEIFEGIVNGIYNAHEFGDVIHRDIKPANVLFMDFSLKEPLISDFGICLLREVNNEARVTEAGETVGAKYFMAPEQERGGVADVNTSADIYALGKLLHHMLTGRYIYREEIDKAFENKELASDPRYKIIHERILTKTVAENPDDRIQTASGLLQIVRAIRLGKNNLVSSQIDKPTTLQPIKDASNERALSSETSGNSTIKEFIRYKKLLSEDALISVKLEFDEIQGSFIQVWGKIYKAIEKKPQETASAALQLIREQPQAMAISFAMARCDAIGIYPSFKKFLEFITRTSEDKSGYIAVFTVPHVQAGFLYMAAATIALQFESWGILSKLLTNKFEWYYQSGRPIYNYGFEHPYFFHPESIKRNAAEAHDLFRGELMVSEIIKSIGIQEDEILNVYLRAQFLMCLRTAQLVQQEDFTGIWPDFGRFHGFRITPLLDKMHADDDYARGIIMSFNETKEEFFTNLNERLKIIESWFSGGRYWWSSIHSWEPR